MITCNKCHEAKNEEAFSFKNKAKGIRLHHCKLCHAAYVKIHYTNNKAAYVDRAKRASPLRYKERMEFVRSLKTICSQCGENHPAVLDFHHTDPNEKEISVSHARSKKQILSEIQKCIVLCSNCHRKLHWNEREGK